MTDIFAKITQWGYDRQIVQNSTVDAQFKKLIEEVGELATALNNDNKDEVIDAIGDCTVVLTLLAEMINEDFEYCAHHAYQQIKDRTGHLNKEGVFIKDE